MRRPIYFFFFLGDSFLKADGHNLLTRHSEHFGDLAEQIVCPNPTSIRLTELHLKHIEGHSNEIKKLDFTYNSTGSQPSSSKRVFSGSDVGFETQPKRLAIRWTWTSTPMPVQRFHADFMQMWAIFGPTPGNFCSPSRVCGMSQSQSLTSIIEVFLMFFALVL